MIDHENAIKIHLKQIMPDWKNIQIEKIIVQRMTGITNETYKVSAEDKDPVIYRKFGSSTENVFLNRQTEQFVYSHISQAGLGPKIYFNNGDVRVQSFIESTVLPSKKMLQIGYLEDVAYALAKFHQLKPKSPLVPYESMLKRIFFDRAQLIMENCHKKMNLNIFDQSEKEILNLLKKWVSQQEIDFLKKVSINYEKQELVFSHNDLLANNVLIKKDGEVVLIDYQYAGYNYPIFDIANYFREAQYDYEVTQPPYFKVNNLEGKEDNKLRFIEAYIVAGHVQSRSQFIQNFEQMRKSQQIQAEKEKLLNRLDLGELLSVLAWGWWGIISSKNPAIQFDYIAFCEKRYKDYQKLKSKLLI